MNETALVHHYLVVGALLFGIGLVGFLSRRNLVVIFLAAELMLQGVSLSLVAWGRYHHDRGGAILVLFLIAVAACQAAIGLALIAMLFRRCGSLDVTVWHALREANQPPPVDQDLSETPPELPGEKTDDRHHV